MEFVESLSVGEHHLRGLGVRDDDSTAASWTSKSLLSGYFEPAVWTPDILVSSSYEYRLPDTEMFPGTALFPLRHRQSCHPERPSRLLFPLVHVLGSIFASLVEEAPLSLLAERGRDRLDPAHQAAPDRPNVPAYRRHY